MKKHLSGFTLVETIIAVALAAAVILPAAFVLLRGVDRVRARLDSQATTQSLASDLEGLVRRDLLAAAAGLGTTPNTTGLMVRVGGPDGAEQDTLYLLIPTGSPWAVSTRACTSGSLTCLRILGRANDSLPIGALLHVAAPTIGGQIVQVTSVDTLTAPCGLDCTEPVLSCGETLGAALQRLRVIGSRRVDIGGLPGPVTPNTPCDSTVYGNGETCQELYAVEPVDTSRTLSCVAPPTPSQTYSDVSITDRTVSVRWLAPPIAPPARSGPRGQPLVTVQGVRLIRYYLRPGVNGTSQLMRDIDLNAAGAWNPPEVLSNRLVRWRVSTVHAGDSVFRRGFQVTDADLNWNGANPNRWNLSGETIPDSGWVGFRRSAATVGGFQLDFAVLPRNTGPQASTEDRSPKEYRVKVGLPRMLDGGTPFPGAH